MTETVGRPRSVVTDLPAYRPGKGAKQAEDEHGITDAVKLASNENPAPTLDVIVDAITQAARGSNDLLTNSPRPVTLRVHLAERSGEPGA